MVLLFGKEFDADEGAEVGGGLRGVEMELTDVPAILFKNCVRVSEDDATQFFPAVNAYGYGCDFVAIDHTKLSWVSLPRLKKAVGNAAVGVAELPNSSLHHAGV